MRNLFYKLTQGKIDAHRGILNIIVRIGFLRRFWLAAADKEQNHYSLKKNCEKELSLSMGLEKNVIN